MTLAPVRKLSFVSLDELKEMPELAECRLSPGATAFRCCPLTEAEFHAIVAAADAKK